MERFNVTRATKGLKNREWEMTYDKECKTVDLQLLLYLWNVSIKDTFKFKGCNNKRSAIS